jgi:hypothetical protein
MAAQARRRIFLTWKKEIKRQKANIKSQKDSTLSRIGPLCGPILDKVESGWEIM